jgi:hypothetical protein
VGLLDTSSGGLDKMKRTKKVESDIADGDDDDDDQHIWAVFLAALVASCLRGAFPGREITSLEHLAKVA